MFEYYYEFEDEHIAVDLDAELGKGGEGSVFTLKYKNQVFNHLGHCVKKYHQGISEKTIQKIQLMISMEAKYTFAERGICWPLSFLKNKKNEIVGYVMPIANAKQPLRIWFLPLRQTLFKGWNRNNLCDLLINILEKFEILHSHGIIVGDINDANILVDPSDPSNCSFVDVDSYQIKQFNCPVGATEYVPPELQGQKLEHVTRTLRHEYYTLAVLLFKVMMFGQHPYTIIGGEDIVKNIKNSNFPYPLGGDYDGLEPLGKYLDYWNMLSSELKNMFYDTFKKQDRRDVASWIKEIKEYDSAISNMKYTIALDVEYTTREKIVVKFDDGRKKGEGTLLTDISKNKIPLTVAVIELSTRAVKFITGDISLLSHGFNWDAFKNDAILTNTGQLIEDGHLMRLDLYKNNILPIVMNYIETGLKKKVDRFYCVATAAYRMANNRTEILKLIQQEASNRFNLNFNIQILDRNQEADYTYRAYSWAEPAALRKPILLIDQGGGSTEITLFENGEKKLSANIPMGTESMLRLLFVNSVKNNTLKNSIDDANRWSRRNTFDSMKNLFDYVKDHQIPIEIIALGSAITKATGKTGNRKQHGVSLTVDQIIAKKNQLTEEISLLIPSLNDLDKYINARVHGRNKQRTEDDTYESIIHLFGLMMYEHILNRLDKKILTVNGVALRYGVFKSCVDTVISQPGFQEEILQVKKDRSEYNGLYVDQIYEGKINNIREYGCFVMIDQANTGLLHVSNLIKKKKKLEDFYNGQKIKVKILEFQKHDNKMKINLDYIEN